MAEDAPEADEIQILRDLAYREGGNPRWQLDLAMRVDAQGKPRPAIVVIHGGGWIEGDKSSFSRREDKVPGNIIDFARLGFVAVTVNYRLSREAPYPAALEVRLELLRPAVDVFFLRTLMHPEQAQAIRRRPIH